MQKCSGSRRTAFRDIAKGNSPPRRQPFYFLYSVSNRVDAPKDRFIIACFDLENE